MRALKIVTQVLFIAVLPVLLVTSSLVWALNSVWMHNYNYEKYNISQTTGLAASELDKIARELINYFNSDEEYIELTVTKNGETFELFNERELIHLKDVKGIVEIIRRLWIATLIYVAVYTGVCFLWQRGKHWRRLAWGAVIGSGSLLGVMLAVGLIALLNFDWLFLQFHLQFFSNDFWQLDPTKDYMIMLYSQGFWYDAARFCGMIIIGGAVTLLGVGVAYLWRGRSKRAVSA